MTRKTYNISVDGCDDSTLIKMELDEKEHELINNMITLVNAASSYQCMPTMEMWEEGKDRWEDD